MQVEIYADVVFFINFVMDFFIFWIVSKFIKKKVRLLRITIGAAVAAMLYCLLIFTVTFRPIYNIFGVIALLLISILICFNPKSVKEFIKLFFLTNIAAFSVGGTGIALFYFTNIGDVVGNMLGFTVHNFSFKILIVSSCTSFVIIKFAVKWYKRIFIKRQTFCSISVLCGENLVELNALIDTGNSLHEPITNNPVIVAEFPAVKDVLPDSLKVIYYEKMENNLNKILECTSNTSFAGKIRMIPFSSLGMKNGMLIGVKADKVTIKADKDIILNNAVIAVYNFKLSDNGLYNALLNPEVLENGI